MVISKRIIADLQVVEGIETELPFQQLRDIVGRAMKGAVPVFANIAEGTDYVERKFSYTRRGSTYTILLRANISGTDKPDFHQLLIGVTTLQFPVQFGIPAIGERFRKAARVRRKVIRAVLKADPLAESLVGVSEFEHK